MNKCLQCNSSISDKAKYCSDKCRMAFTRTNKLVQPEVVKRDYIYIMQCHNEYYKIGWTSDTNKRLQSMKTGNPFRIRLLFSARLADTVMLEGYLHREYSQYRVRGEWFKLDNEHVLKLIKFIVTYLLENPRI